jgi:hypothetical protein
VRRPARGSATGTGQTALSLQGKPDPTRRLLKIALLSAVIMVFLIASRLPFICNPLLGEEGLFAALILDHRASHPMLLAGQVDGAPIYSSFEHTILPYYFIKALASPLANLYPYTSLGFPARSALVRSSYFLLFLAGALPLVIMAASNAVRSSTRIGASAVVLFTLYLFTTPLALGASIQAQVDGSIGVLLMGLSSFVALGCGGTLRSPPMLVLAGFLLGVGRMEWCVAFSAAAVALLCLSFVVRLANRMTLAFLVAGMASGVAVSFLVSPSDYLGGLHLADGVLMQAAGQMPVWAAFLRYWLPLVIIAAASLLFLFRRTRASNEPDIVAALYLLGGCAILAGFMASGWAGDGFPRYYSPALLAVGAAALSFYARSNFSRFDLLVLAVCALGLVVNARTLYGSWTRSLSITSLPGTPLAGVYARFDRIAEQARRDHSVVLAPSAIWLYHPEVSFIGQDFGEAGARSFLLRQGPSIGARFAIPDP